MIRYLDHPGELDSWLDLRKGVGLGSDPTISSIKSTKRMGIHNPLRSNPRERDSGTTHGHVLL
jgi:hypothetical protein